MATGNAPGAVLFPRGWRGGVRNEDGGRHLLHGELAPVDAGRNPDYATAGMQAGSRLKNHV